MVTHESSRRPGGTRGAATDTGPKTFVLTDIVGSTRRWELDPETMGPLLASHDEAIADVVDQRGGSLIRSKGEGDSTFSVFDDAVGALAAAADIQRGVPDGIRVRIGVHTGPAEYRDGQFYGTTVNRAARLRSVANGGQVVVSAATTALVADDLAEDLGLRDLGERRLKDLSDPERVFQLTGPGLADDFPALRWLDPRRSNLNLPSSSFIGRTDDLARVIASVRGRVLTTLVGPGGAGKTRLATEAAFDMADDFDGGVWLVELVGERSEDAVGGRVLAATGLKAPSGTDPLDALAHHLGGREALVLLDNCEHIRDSCAQVAVRLAACGVRVLATSRVPLRTEGEATCEVEPLSLGSGTEDPADADAVRLFVDRAAAANPALHLGGDAPRTILDICRRLDGLPLAIELAAARCRLMSIDELAARLDRVFATVAGPRGGQARHRTLEALIDWSCDLLEPDERVLLDRLGIFRGPFDLTDVEAVCTSPELGADQILAALDELVDHHLVTVDVSRGVGRYRLLETIREYAAERLRSDKRRLADRHLSHFLEMARTAAAVTPDRQPHEVQRLEGHRTDLSAAIEHAVATQQVDAALELGACLWRFWLVRGGDEATEHLEAILALEGGHPEHRTGALIGAATLGSADPQRAWERGKQALELAEATAKPELIGDVYTILSNILLNDDPEQAIDLAERAIDWLTRGSDRQMERIARLTLSVALASLDRPEGYPQLREVLAEAEEAGDDYVIALTAANIPGVEASEDAEDLAARARAAADRLGLDQMIPRATFNEAAAVARSGNRQRSRMLFDRAVAELAAQERSAADNTPVVAEMLYDAACELYAVGDIEKTTEYVDRAAALDPPHPLRWWFDGLRGALARDAGDLPAALRWFREALSGATEHLSDRNSQGRALVGLRCIAGLAALAGDHQLADRWFAAVESITSQVNMGPADGLVGTRDEAIVRGDRSPEEFRQALAHLGEVDAWTVVPEVVDWLEADHFPPRN